MVHYSLTHLLTHSLTHSDHILAYVASDNKRSSSQINETLHWPNTIVPSDICHVDMSANSLCALGTFAQWLMLSLSDTIVMQALIPDTTMTAFHDPKDSYKEEGPVSAFSRFAAIYSLSTEAFKYGISCRSVNTKQLSRQVTHSLTTHSHTHSLTHRHKEIGCVSRKRSFKSDKNCI